MTLAFLALLFIQDADHSKRAAGECLRDGVVLFDRRKYGEALRELDHAVAKKPSDAVCRYNRGRCLFELQKFEEAAKDFFASTTYESKHAEGWLMRGRALRALSQWSAAADALREAIRLAPKLRESAEAELKEAESKPRPNVAAGEYLPLWGHFTPVWILKFSTDSSELLSVADPEVHWWSVPDGRDRKTLDPIGTDGASGDLRWLVSWAPDAIDTKTGEEIKVKEHADPLAVAVSDDGRLYCGRGAGETIDVWEVSTGKRVCVLNGTGPLGICEECALSADGSLAALASGKTIRVWDVGLRKMKSQRAVPEYQGFGLKFASDGRFVFCCGAKAAYRWDLSTGKLEAFESEEKLSCFDVTPRGDWMVAGTESGRVLLWPAPGKPARSLQAHPKKVGGIAVSPDARWIATSEGHQVRLWSGPAASQATDWRDEWAAWKDFPVGAWVQGEATFDDGVVTYVYEIASKTDDLITLTTRAGSNQNPGTKTIRKGIRPSEECAHCRKPMRDHYAFQSERPQKVKAGPREIEGVRVDVFRKSCDMSKNLETYEWTFSRIVPGWRVQEGLEWRVVDFGVEPRKGPTSNELLEKGLKLLEEGKPRDALDPLSELIRLEPKNAEAWKQRGWARLDLSDFREALADLTQAIALSPKDALARGLRGECRSKLEHWEACIRDLEEAGRLDAKEKETVQEMLATARKRLAAGERLLEGCTSAITALAASPDGRTVAAAGQENKVFLWDLESVRLLQTIKTKDKLLGLAFSPDGTMLATAAGQAPFTDVTVWESPTGKLLRQWAGPIGVTSLAFSSDGKSLVAGAVRIKTFPVAGGDTKLWGIGGPAAYLADGSVAVGDGAGSLLVLDLAAEKQTRYSGHARLVSALAVGRGGRIATASIDGTVRLWDARRNSRVLHFHALPSGLTFSADGRILAVSGLAETRFIDTETASEFHVESWKGPIVVTSDRWLHGDVLGAVHVRPIGEAISGGPARVKKAIGEYERGVKLGGKGDLEGADKAFTAAIAQNSRMARAYADRATVRLQQFRLDDAFGDYDIALDIDEKMPEALLGKGVIRSIQSEKSPSERALLVAAESYIAKALELGGAGWAEWQKANGALKEIRKRLEKLKK